MSGYAGWSTFLVSGGVGAWLLFRHLPQLFAKHDRDLAAKDSQIIMLISKNDATIEKFERSLSGVLEHCEKENGRLVDALKEEFKESRKVLEKLREGRHAQRRQVDGES